MYLAVLTALVLPRGIICFDTYVCPKEVAKGIPFDLYGSPLFPVALYDRDEVSSPFWVSLAGGWMDELLRKLDTTGVGDCLLDDLPKCEEDMRNTFGKILEKALSPHSPSQLSKYLVNKVKEEEWGDSPLYDFGNATLVAIRRTLLMQCMYWCHTMLSLPANRRPMMLEMCPNPCNEATVCSGIGEIHGTCRLTEEGFFVHQYQCECKPGYVWTVSALGCIPENPCERKKAPFCNPQGTLLCSYDPELNDVSCLCKPEYMGENCSVPANACDDLIRNPLLPNGGLIASGNRACNINNDGNRCVPALDPDLGPVYSCICATDRWTGDINLGYENCLKKITKCDHIICIHGECVDSRDGKEAMCVCTEGYDSPMCATWTGVWSPWTPWSRCMPACGEERWAIRTRQCLVAERFGANSEHIDCRGPSVDFTRCEVHACAPAEKVQMTQYFEIREYALQTVIAIGAVTAALLTLCWKWSFHTKLALRVRRMLQC